MDMDFEQIFDAMLGAGRSELQAGGARAQDYFRQVMTQQKALLAELARAGVRGDLSRAELERELAGIRRDVVVELEGLEVIAREGAENAWNAAVGVLVRAIGVAL